jgi:hypothetical protein
MSCDIATPAAVGVAPRILHGAFSFLSKPQHFQSFKTLPASERFDLLKINALAAFGAAPERRWTRELCFG